jgi:LacI family transcriptional regulator
MRWSRGADQRAQELGYATIMAHTESHAESEEQAVRLLLDKRVNGIIFTTPVTIKRASRNVRGACAVMIERPLPVPGAHAVVIDHRRGIYDLTCMLVEQGHHHIAYVGGDFSLPGSDLVERERLRGFRTP